MTIWISGHSIFAYNLAPDYDFKQDILSFGDTVEVMKPEALRKTFMVIVEHLHILYQTS